MCAYGGAGGLQWPRRPGPSGERTYQTLTADREGMETPSHTLFADLKSFGHVSHRDAAHVLLSPTASSNGMSIRSRAATDRTFLSRDIVRARPGRYGRDAFGSFPRATRQLESLVLSHLRDEGAGETEFAEHYLGVAAESMARAVEATGQDVDLYRNALARVGCAEGLEADERAYLAFMLFVVTGCLGDPRHSTDVVRSYAESSSLAVHTMESGIGTGYPPPRAIAPGRACASAFCAS